MHFIAFQTLLKCIFYMNLLVTVFHPELNESLEIQMYFLGMRK